MDLDAIFNRATLTDEDRPAVGVVEDTDFHETDLTPTFMVNERPERYTYHYRVVTGGGTIITDLATIDEVEKCLQGMGWTVIEVKR